MSFMEKPLLLLRAFPLSISILIRFLLVLPLWAIFYIAITVIAIVSSLQIMATAPIVGIMVLMILSVLAFAISYIISMHPYLIGIRIGLRVLGIETRQSQKRLLAGAVGFGFLEAIVATVLLGIILVGDVLVIQRDFGLLSAIDIDQIPDPVASLSRQISFGVLVVLPILSSIVVMALRAALLPAMANFVVGRDPSGRFRSNLDGFGANFITMMLLMLMITGVSAVVIPLVGDAFQYVGLTTALLDGLSDIVLFAFGEQEMTFTLAHALAVIAALIISIWLFCLQCAGAALSYENRVNAISIGKKLKTKSSLGGHESMAELRRSRMPDRSK